MAKSTRPLPDACCSLTIRGREQDRFLGMLKAAGNPIRFEVLKFLVTHPGCITGDLVDHLPISQATVSQHLKVLREAGWIEGEITGPAVCYTLSRKNIDWFRTTTMEIF